MKTNEGKHKKKKDARDSRSAAAVTTDGTTGDAATGNTAADQQNRLVASIINGITNATRSSAPVVQFPSNESRAVSSARRNTQSHSTPDDSS